MYCNKCGKQIEEHTKFCPYCGQINNLNTVPKEISSNLYIERIDGQFVNRKSYNGYLSTSFALIGFTLVVLNYIAVPYVHLIGIPFGIVAVALCQKDKRNERNYSRIGNIFGVMTIILGIISMIIGAILYS